MHFLSHSPKLAPPGAGAELPTLCMLCGRLEHPGTCTTGWYSHDVYAEFCFHSRAVFDPERTPEQRKTHRALQDALRGVLEARAAEAERRAGARAQAETWEAFCARFRAAL